MSGFTEFTVVMTDQGHEACFDVEMDGTVIDVYCAHGDKKIVFGGTTNWNEHSVVSRAFRATRSKKNPLWTHLQKSQIPAYMKAISSRLQDSCLFIDDESDEFDKSAYFNMVHNYK